MPTTYTTTLPKYVHGYLPSPQNILTTLSYKAPRGGTLLYNRVEQCLDFMWWTVILDYRLTDECTVIAAGHITGELW